MRFSPESGHGANAGLGRARDLLAPIAARFPGLSVSDLWTLAGATAIEAMGGPAIVWRPGRVDALDGSACTPDGRLPDADKGALRATVNGLRSVFARMGFTDDADIVALSGAHCLGRCHPEASGCASRSRAAERVPSHFLPEEAYKLRLTRRHAADWGPWTNAETTFSALYFQELLARAGFVRCCTRGPSLR